MTELLQQLSEGASLTLNLEGFAVCLALSFLFSLATEILYLVFYENRGSGSQIHRGFLLIGPSITLLFICVQLSLPLSLGLLGALSIVRFRTPIKEPEEVGFIMLLIASSIGISTFNFPFVAVLYGAVLLVLAVKRWMPRPGGPWKRRDGILLVNLDDDEYLANGTHLESLLRSRFRGLHLDSATTAEGATSLQFLFSRMDASSWADVQREIKEAVSVRTLNVFLHRPGAGP